MPAIFDDELARHVQRMVRQFLQQERDLTGPSAKYPPRPLSWQWAISNSAISAASSGLTAPGSGTAEILIMDSDKDLSRSGKTYTVYNRSESVSIASDTLVIIARFKGERVIVWSDCAALANPPA